MVCACILLTHKELCMEPVKAHHIEATVAAEITQGLIVISRGFKTDRLVFETAKIRDLISILP